ncbi:hypothetical protein [Streptomyces sp. CNQ-509]|uniref:hypothetical protein n=1 Tax=Streptomyces sp. CNQ-509 TaxID=444103 RepID=UPI0011A5DCCF|nr:hypothetical protein [Streptomyces sp. CNQ-509]
MNQVIAAVEGVSDQGAVRAILNEFNLSVQMFQGGKGKNDLLKKLPAYNKAAQHIPWFVLVDMDSVDGCVAEEKAKWLPIPSEYMVFRIAVTELESWLLADREAMAEFLSVPFNKIPNNQDQLGNPKQEIINLARKSRRRDIRDGLVPDQRSGASIGPTYASDISKFGEQMWRPRVAAQESPSLARCLYRVEELARSLRG